MWHCGHIHAPKIDDSNIIYSGSLTSCGFDEPGEHGMCVGEIFEDDIHKCSNRKDLIKYEFVKIDDAQYETKNIDITNCTSVVEVIDKLELKDNYYKIILSGIRNLDAKKLIDDIYLSNEKVCKIVDDTRYEDNLEKIAEQKTLKGIFVRNMLEELKKNPKDERVIMQAIEYVLH